MNKHTNKILIIIEWAWIVMAVFCIIAGIYYQIKIGVANSWLIYLLAVISLGMYFVRRMQRKNIEKRQNHN